MSRMVDEQWVKDAVEYLVKNFRQHAFANKSNALNSRRGSVAEAKHNAAAIAYYDAALALERMNWRD
jgi:hypothetical protein